MSAVVLPYLSGLPAGDGWLPTGGSAEVVFPSDGSTIAGTRRGASRTAGNRPCCSTSQTANRCGTRRCSGRSCVCRVADVEHAFDEVNRFRFCLHASICTASLGYAFAALQGLDVGGVVVNELPGFHSDTRPHGAVRDSGTGREDPGTPSRSSP